MDWPSFSAVSQGFTVIFPNISRVAADYSQCLRVALREARRLGYRRIGLHVLSEIDLRCQQLWTGSFLAAQLLIPEEDRVPICPLEKRGKAAFQAWVTACSPEVILTFTGTTLPWLEEMKLRIPDDIGLINLGRHHEEPRELRDPCNWAGVEHPMEEIGAAATDLVMAQLIANERGLPASPRSVTLPGRWINGWTVKDQKRVVPIMRGLKRRSSHGRYPDGKSSHTPEPGENDRPGSPR
jgi:LacI family transcriptional regulator